MVVFLKLVSGFFAAIPYRWALAMGGAMGWLYGHLIRYHRQDAFAALKSSFPDKRPTEIRRLVNAMYRHLGLNLAEFMRALGGKSDELAAHVKITGVEHVENALKLGNGALALVSHVGNWELLAVAMAKRFQPSGMIIKEMKNQAMHDFFLQCRREQKIMVFERRGSYRALFRALQRNTLIGFVLDQNMMWKEGVFVEFFGRPACTTPGLAHLAAQSCAPVIPMFIYRRDHGQHELVIQPALAPPAGRDPDLIHEATQRYTRIIEDAIRKSPEQWIWIHRRWRTTPDKVEQIKRLKSGPAVERETA